MEILSIVKTGTKLARKPERPASASRYPGREEEVAARIVNKQRAQAGETKAEHPASHQTR